MGTATAVPTYFFPNRPLGLVSRPNDRCGFISIPYLWFSGKFVGINYALLPNRQWNKKQKHKKQPWSNVECFAFGVAKRLFFYVFVSVPQYFSTEPYLLIIVG
ncbi:MAG: hypothetical protein MSA44_03185, partial [Bacteroidales bacterium]|nr:hypothetical protein [Bacteroidales bacterium]